MFKTLLAWWRGWWYTRLIVDSDTHEYVILPAEEADPAHLAYCGYEPFYFTRGGRVYRRPRVVHNSWYGRHE